MEITDILVSLLTLIALEVILGIDNIIFISILSDKLPEKEASRLRRYGIGLAMIFRLGLLALIAWIMRLDQGLFKLMGMEFSGKDLILLSGGLFLLYKSTMEIYHKTEEAEKLHIPGKTKAKATFNQLLGQILLLDMVFSIDSIITAVGLVEKLWVMYIAVVVSVMIMMIAAKPISDFINRHPSFKVLALSFLLMIGITLVAEGLDVHFPKGYIYFAMAFAFFVDVLQLKTIRPKQPDQPS
jgi:predicted tellurium resistance membrane protein TerC